MSDPASAARFERIRRNPGLFPGVAEALGPSFSWHSHAGSPRSSQALCLSAWYPLATLACRHEIIERFLTPALPVLQRVAGRRWQVSVEVVRPEVLGETGGGASSIDVLLESDDAVVCLESKYLSDAGEGFGRCRQFPGSCRGYYGEGSDAETGSSAPCRMAAGVEGRAARRYWAVAARLFRSSALEPRREVGSCPLHHAYQLARNLFFAAEWGRLTERQLYAALGVAPAAGAGIIEHQAEWFRTQVLRPEHADRIGVAHYEQLVHLLLALGDDGAARLGRFIASRLPAAPAPPPRTESARELKLRAHKERLRKQRER